MSEEQVTERFNRMVFDGIPDHFYPEGIGAMTEYEGKLIIADGLDDMKAVLDYDFMTGEAMTIFDLIDIKGEMDRVYYRITHSDGTEESKTDKLKAVDKLIQLVEKKKPKLRDFSYQILSRAFGAYRNAIVGTSH